MSIESLLKAVIAIVPVMVFLLVLLRLDSHRLIGHHLLAKVFLSGIALAGLSLPGQRPGTGLVQLNFTSIRASWRHWSRKR